MQRNDIIRHFFGYLVGGTLFLVLVPLLLYRISLSEKSCFDGLLCLPRAARLSVSIPVGIMGLVFAAWSNLYLFMIGKGGPTEGFGIAISPRTRKLVTTGPYKYSRNPMVFGVLSTYFSLSVYFDSLICVVLILLAGLLGSFYLKRFEEKRLLRDFGDEYRAYQRRVPMLIPFFRHKKQTPEDDRGLKRE